MSRRIPSLLLSAAILSWLPVTAYAQTQQPAGHLRTIVHLVSHPVCGVLKKSVGPAIEGLMLNDQTITKASGDLARYLGTTHSSAGHFLSLSRAEQSASIIAQRIKVMKGFLADPRLASKTASSDENQYLADLKKRLALAIADQETTLNILYGTADSSSLSTAMRGDDIENLLAHNNGLPAPRKTAYANVITDMHTTAYDPGQGALAALQQLVQVRRFHESALASSIISAAHECIDLKQDDVKPSPSP